MLARYSCLVIGVVSLYSIGVVNLYSIGVVSLYSTVCYSCLVVVFMLEGGVGDTQNVGAVFMFSHWRGKLV